MKRHDIQSTLFKSVGYDPTCGVMEVEYRTLGTYQFLGVPAKTYQGFSNATEKEAFFRANIVNSYFKIPVGGR